MYYHYHYHIFGSFILVITIILILLTTNNEGYCTTCKSDYECSPMFSCVDGCCQKNKS